MVRRVIRLKKENNGGFTLIELMLAILISLIVGAALLVLLTYSSNNMAQTQSKVSIQEEAKDVMNHITNIGMEGSYATCSAIGATIPTLTIKNTTTDNEERKEVVYWQIGNSIYYSPTKDIDVADLKADDMHLLGEQVSAFLPKIKKNPSTGKQMIDITLKMKNKDTSFDTSYLVYLRNQ